MYKIIFLMAGGALGTLSRFYVAGLSHKFLAGLMPWGTLVVNSAGAFFIGLFWALFELKDVSPNTRMFIAVGFLGGFTTFSTFVCIFGFDVMSAFLSSAFGPIGARS